MRRRGDAGANSRRYAPYREDAQDGAMPGSYGEGVPQPGSSGSVRLTDSRASTSRYLENVFSVIWEIKPPSL